MRVADELKTGTRRQTTSQTMFSSNVPAAKRAKILAEATPLLTAHIKCEDLWAALQMADYKKEGVLNDAAVTVMFDKEREKFCELLLVSSSEELQELLDENEDGFLNEDEQLLIFSLVKERMQALADDLCSIHEYTLYKDMMKAIRALEANIVNYQEILRKRTHDKELTIYRELGEEKVQKFKEDWHRRFQLFREESQLRMETVKKKHALEMEELAEAMRMDTDVMKVKPKARLRNLQTEEKLVAVNERFNEAQKIRNELKVLEIDEQNRVENKILHDQDKRRHKLLKQQEKEIRQVQLKNQTAYYSLKIKMEQQYSRLQKEIKLYLNDITKNQNLAQRLARRLGETRDELRRTKKKAKEMMMLMSAAKTVPSSRQKNRHGETLGSLKSNIGSLPQLPKPPGSRSSMSATLSNARSSSPLKQTLKKITKFGIASDVPGSEKPINTGPNFMKSSSRSKLTAELIGKHASKTSLKSLGSLYTDSLEPLEALTTD